MHHVNSKRLVLDIYIYIYICIYIYLYIYIYIYIYIYKERNDRTFHVSYRLMPWRMMEIVRTSQARNQHCTGLHTVIHLCRRQFGPINYKRIFRKFPFHTLPGSILAVFFANSYSELRMMIQATCRA